MLTIYIQKPLPLASSCVVEVDFDGFRARTRVELDQAHAVDQLAASLSDGPPGLVVDAARHDDPSGPLLLEIEDENLFTVPWESLRFREPLAGRSVIRTTKGPANRALVPVDLPVDLLIGSLHAAHPEFDPGESQAHRYFRVTRTSPATVDLLNRIGTGATFEIIHLRGVGAWTDDQGTLSPEFGPPLDHHELASLTVGTGARLLILETTDTDTGPALDLAHRSLRADGPSIVVITTHPEPGRPDSAHVQDLLMDAVHDVPLDHSIGRLQANGVDVALLRHSGGEHLLRISSSAQSLVTDFVDYHSAADQLLLSVESRATVAPEDEDERLESLHLAVQDLNEWRDSAYDYSRESGAWEPLTDASKKLENLKAALPELAAVQRVVNVWFGDGHANVPAATALMTSRTYELKVHVGLPAVQSINRSLTSFPDAALPFASPDGVEVDVILFSRDLKPLAISHSMTLPPAPADSPVLSIPFVTPSEPGMATARLGIYFRQQLLQSLRLTVTVASAEGTPGVQTADTDYVLSGGLTDVDQFEDRGLNIVMNDESAGTHMIGIVGGGPPRSFTLSDTEMGSKAAAARKALQDVCSTAKGGRPDKYRFEPNNAGPPPQLLNEIRELARLGYTLYADLVVGHDWEFEDDLQRSLALPTIIQIAVTATSTRVFPWALIYDQPLITSAQNTLCPEFQRALTQGGPPGWTDRLTCFSSRCTSADDPYVICPSGFWGFRHVIEQPLGTHRRKAMGAGPSPVVPDAPRTIDAPYNANLLMAVSEELSGLKAHSAEVVNLGSFHTDVHSDRFQIGASLQRTDLHVVYFYCHGGREDVDVWLGVGRKQRLYPSDLNAWRIRWATTNPLVFINGCETVGVTPDDLMSFLDALAYSRASGVIGVEITIPEKLARRFANEFLAAFGTGAPVGDVVRSGRRRLLELANPLGLAYTPYCVADLRLVTHPN